MKIREIVWLEEVINKIASKHAVHFEEVEELFENQPRFEFVEKGHRRGEDVYAASGKNDAGRLLVAFFILKPQGRALVLTAREMTQREKRRYEKK
ncbi:MAG: BrnT family toxin [bacterium]